MKRYNHFNLTTLILFLFVGSLSKAVASNPVLSTCDKSNTSTISYTTDAVLLYNPEPTFSQDKGAVKKGRWTKIVKSLYSMVKSIYTEELSAETSKKLDNNIEKYANEMMESISQQKTKEVYEHLITEWNNAKMQNAAYRHIKKCSICEKVAEDVTGIDF